MFLFFVGFGNTNKLENLIGNFIPRILCKFHFNSVLIYKPSLLRRPMAFLFLCCYFLRKK